MRKALLLSFAFLASISVSQQIKVASTVRTKLDFPSGTRIKALSTHLLYDSSFAVVVNTYDGVRNLPAVAVFNRNGAMTACYHWNRPENFIATTAKVSDDGESIFVAGRYSDAATSVSDLGWFWYVNIPTGGLTFTRQLDLPSQTFWSDTPVEISEIGNNIAIGGFRSETSATGGATGRPFISFVDKSGNFTSYKTMSGQAEWNDLRVLGMASGGGRTTLNAIGTMAGNNHFLFTVNTSQVATLVQYGGDQVTGGIAYNPLKDLMMYAGVNATGTVFSTVDANDQLSFSSRYSDAPYQKMAVGPDGYLIAVNAGLKSARYKHFNQVQWQYNPPAGLQAQPPINIVINSINEIYTGNYGKANQAYLTKLSSTGVKRWDIFHGPANLDYIPAGFGVHEKSGDILLAGTSKQSNVDQLQVTVLRQAATAIADSFYTPKNKQFYKSLVTNDRAALGSVATIIQGPAHGTASITTTGNLTYKPNNNYTGVDTVKYQLAKTGLTSSSAVCTLHVNP